MVWVEEHRCYSRRRGVGDRGAQQRRPDHCPRSWCSQRCMGQGAIGCCRSLDRSFAWATHSLPPGAVQRIDAGSNNNSKWLQVCHALAASLARCNWLPSIFAWIVRVGHALAATWRGAAQWSQSHSCYHCVSRCSASVQTSVLQWVALSGVAAGANGPAARREHTLVALPLVPMGQQPPRVGSAVGVAAGAPGPAALAESAVGVAAGAPGPAAYCLQQEQLQLHLAPCIPSCSVWFGRWNYFVWFGRPL